MKIHFSINTHCLLDSNSIPEAAIKVNRSKGHVENLVHEMRIKIDGECYELSLSVSGLRNSKSLGKPA